MSHHHLTHWTLTRTTGPAVQAVSVDEAKEHLRLSRTDTTHDYMLEGLIDAAIQKVEKDTDLCLINQTWSLKADEFCGCWMELPKRPLQTVSSVVYVDGDGVSQVLATTVYAVDIGRRQIYLKYGQSWPSHRGDRNGIIVTFVAGYGSSPASVPHALKRAVLLLVGYWFENPDMDSTYKQHTWSDAYDRLIDGYMRPTYP